MVVLGALLILLVLIVAIAVEDMSEPVILSQRSNSRRAEMYRMAAACMDSLLVVTKDIPGIEDDLRYANQYMDRAITGRESYPVESWVVEVDRVIGRLDYPEILSSYREYGIRALRLASTGD